MKIGAIIQARMKSTRLPGKILLTLPFNSTDTLITWPINRLKKSQLINKIIIATSVNKENEVLENVAKSNDVFFYSGSEENVLSRFVDVANSHSLDIVVRITADNPIIDEVLTDELLNLHIKGDYDYSYSVNLPIGMNIEIAKASALNEIFNRKDLIPADEEHVTYFFKRRNLYKVLKHEFNININSDIRLTVDYPADYAMLNLIAEISNKYNIYGVDLVQLIEEKYKWIIEINSHLYQKKPYNSLKEEMSDSFEMLQKHEFLFTLNYLKDTINTA